MKHALFFFCFLVFTATLSAQDPEFVWAKQMGGISGGASGNAIKVDAAGNVYTAGGFGGTVDFDPGPNTFYLTADSYHGSGFLSKFDAQGNFLWAKQLPGGSIALDAAGNVYTTGFFYGTVDFDPGPGTFDLTATTSNEWFTSKSDIFISKFDAQGNFLWAKQIGGAGYDQGSAIAVDAAGNVYTTGHFQSSVDFDPGSGTFNLTAANGSTDMFVSKLDAQGNFLWAKQIGGSIETWGKAIALDAAGNVYTTGQFQGKVDFDPGPGTFNLTAKASDIFISKLDFAGNFLWAKQMKGTRSSYSFNIAVDAAGNVYSTGEFYGTVDFDPGPGTFNLTPDAGDVNGGYDIFVSKLDSAGNFLWAKQLSGDLRSFSFALDAAGNVYTTGFFYGTVDFDPGTRTFTLTSADSRDMFISKLNGAGHFVWAKQIGDDGFAEGDAIALDAANNVYTTGFFLGTMDFDPGLDKFTLTNASGRDNIFVLKLSQQSCTPPTFNLQVVADATCDKSDGKLLLTPTSGTAPYQYSLDAGVTYVSGPAEGYRFEGLSPGTYQLLIKDAGGCQSAIVQQTLGSECTLPCTPPTFLNNGTIVRNPSCGRSDGNITLIPTSGSGAFYYSIDGGQSYVAGPATGQSFEGLAAGTYQLRIKDIWGQGCESEVVTISLYSPNCPTPCTPPTFKNDGTIALHPTCGNRDGALYVVPTSGTAPFLYSKDGGTTYVAGPDAGYGFQNLAPGTYKLRLKDASGCESAIIEKILAPSNCPPTIICTDPTFNPTDRGFGSGGGANNEIYATAIQTTALQSDGKIIIGGTFTSYNGIARNYIARLNTDGSLDAGFNPGTGANHYIMTTALQSDGKILIGGLFTSYNRTARNYIARLNTDGSLDAGFNPGAGANNYIYTTALQSDGKILIGGYFTSYNGTLINRIARLNTDGSLDAGFNPGGTGANGPIYTTSLQSDGKIIISGAFTSYNGTPRARIARLNSDGTLDAGFNSGAGANNEIRTTSLQSDGKVVVGGLFTSFNGIARNYIARLNSDGTLDAGFNPSGTGATGYPYNPPTVIYTTAIQSDGKIIIGGLFTSYNGIARNYIARLNTDGTLDASFNPGTGASGFTYSTALFTTAIQSDGKIIIGGEFTSYDGTARKGIARLNTDGSLDADFNPGTGANGSIYTTALQSDGKIIIGGAFTSYNRTARNYIARLNSDGTLDESFNPASPGPIYTISLQSDGKIIIGGSGIARLNTDGTLDASFNATKGANGPIYTTAVQSDGKVIIGGNFGSYNGTARNNIARLNIDGSLDAGFNPGTEANFEIRTTALQSDGKIIIGGDDFTSYRGTAINKMARLNTDGSLDASFNPGTGADGPIYTTSLQSDGKIIIGGAFTSFNGTGRNRIARVMDCASSCTPPTFLNNGTIVLNATCGKSDGALYVIPTSGTSPFLYSKDGGATYVSGANSGYSFEGLSAGTYQLRIKDATGCESAVVSREVKAENCPTTCTTPPNLLNSLMIISHATCGKNDGALYAIPTSGTAPFQYSKDGGATYVSGPAAGYAFQNLSPGTYQLRIKDASGCESAVVQKTVLALYGDCATAVTPNGKTAQRLRENTNSTLVAYPNPTAGQFKVVLPGYTSQSLQVQILNSKGQVVEQRRVNESESNSVDIDLSSKAKGLYLIKVVSEKGTQSIKVLLQ